VIDDLTRELILLRDLGYTHLDLPARADQTLSRSDVGAGFSQPDVAPALKPAVPEVSPTGGLKPAPTSSRRLSYLEQREWDAMEATVLAAEGRLEEARRRAEDPAVATDANALQERFAALAAAQSEVDRLYARLGEMEEKR